MNNLTTFIKGSSGYSVAGLEGIEGESENSIHFSAYHIIDSSIDISTKITDKKPLSNNELYPSDTIEYTDGDIIIDMYGNVGFVTFDSDNLPIITYHGKLFHFDEKHILPVDTSSNNNCIMYFDASAKLSSIKDYRMMPDTFTNSPMWHHRWQNEDEAPGLLLVPNITKKTLMLDGSTNDSSAWIDTLLNIDTKSYIKLCVLFKNGLSYEKIITSETPVDDRNIVIFYGYLDMIGLEFLHDASGNINRYNTFDDEKSISNYDKNTIKKFCDIYLEYVYQNKIYRSKVEIL